MEQNKRLAGTGFLTFFLSGICAISSGVIVSLLQERYGLSFGLTGSLLSVMSIGNMASSFSSGMLPGKIGFKRTAAILCAGYCLGYLLMTASGLAAVLLTSSGELKALILLGAFFVVGAIGVKLIFSSRDASAPSKPEHNTQEEQKPQQEETNNVET